MERLVIGLMGMKQAGKSTVGQILAVDGFTILEPGQQVMSLLLDINPTVELQSDDVTGYLTTRELYDAVGYEGFKGYPDGRRLLQELGTRIRERDPWFWVNQQHKVIENSADVVNTSVRFVNEGQLIRAYDGTMIEIVSPLSPDDDEHVSEHEWRKITPDYMITNDGTLRDLATSVRDLIEGLR
jgi:hypothetical protein